MFFQYLIHKFEMITQARLFKALLLLLAAVLLAVVYDCRNFKNMSTQEAMDSAQLARNISGSKGFTTQFVRPLSLYLLRRAREGNSVASTNAMRFEGGVPDISNPPTYPYLLAGLMKLATFHFHIPGKDERINAFWGDGRNFRRYQPDFLIAIFNEGVMFIMLALAFLWARKLFDSVVAWSSAALILGTEVLWRFSISGLSTLLVMLIFMVLVWCLTLFEIEAREPKWGRHGAMILAGVTGAIVGMGTLTRYSFAWLLIPTLTFVFISAGLRKVTFVLAALLTFTLVTAPWVARNFQLSGAPFGTATYSVLADTGSFPGYTLERSLNPELRTIPRQLWTKLFTNLYLIRQGNLFNLGTGWATALFLTGFLIAFHNLTLTRIRYFVALCLGTLILVQALGRTHLSVDSPRVNSENLLVILLPIVVIYAVGFLWMLLARLQLPPVELGLVSALFGAVSCLSLILSLLKPAGTTVTYPPYFPPVLQQTTAWLKPEELMMSDIPWAVAWYGNKPCVWLTLSALPASQESTTPENIMALNRAFRPISALYLSPLSTDSRLLSDCMHTPEGSWGRLVMNCVSRKEVPPEFGLSEMPAGFLPEQLFLTEAGRWREDPVMPAEAEMDPSLMPWRPSEKRSKAPKFGSPMQ